MSSAPQIDPASRDGNGRAAAGGCQAADAARANEGQDPGATARHRQWRASLAIFTACSALLIWLFRAEIAAAVHLWNTSPTFGHAFFILPITLFLFYRQRRNLATLTPKAAPWALGLIAGITIFWILGDLANVMMVKQLAFVALWQATFLLVLGWQVTRASIFPLAYLFLAVPLGSEIIPLLQDVTAQMVVHLLRFTGMPVFLDGYYIQIPSGSFLVAEACSGLRFLIVCIALGILIAHLFFRSWVKRLIFMGLCLVVPIVANGIRAYGIIMLAHLSDYQLAADVDHIIYGFIFLSVIILVLVSLTAVLRDRNDPLTLAPANPARPEMKEPRSASAALQYGGQALVACLAIGTVFLAQAWSTSAKAPPQSDLAAILRAPPVSPPWRALAPGSTGWHPEFHNTDAVLHQTYQRAENQLDLHVGYYRYQRESAEAASEANRLVGGNSGWSVLERQPATVSIGGQRHPIIRSILRGSTRSYVVWYWYRVGGQRTNSRVVGKLLELKAMAEGGERAAAIVAIASEVFDDISSAEALLEDFLSKGVTSGDSLVRIEESPPVMGETMLDSAPLIHDMGANSKP